MVKVKLVSIQSTISAGSRLGRVDRRLRVEIAACEKASERGEETNASLSHTCGSAGVLAGSGSGWAGANVWRQRSCSLAVACGDTKAGALDCLLDAQLELWS